ncbi:MAG TPA: pyridoxal-dependent decarboxylase [Actinomycetota bacterium]|nr:pyridoxal-dependent decarboxylase [Actinomycetota bacterium]
MTVVTGGPDQAAVTLAAMVDRFDWSPEPDLLDIRDPGRSRPSLEALGEATWREALDWLYDHAMERPVHGQAYPEARETFFGPSRQPVAAPMSPTTSDKVLAEFRARVAPNTYNAQHPGSFSYFTPPPLPMSIAGEVLSQWIHQGVDVWHAGPIGAFVEEEVTGWLRDLVGFREDGWGVLTSGGVMANIMAMTLARDVWLAKLRGTPGAPRGSDLERVRVYASDQTHFSIGRALDVLGFPEGTLRVVPSDERFRLLAGPVADAIAEDREAGLTPLAIAAVAGSTNTGSVDDVRAMADLSERESLWLHVDAAYGGAARLSQRDAHRVPGLERADSVTIDPHKWFFQAYDIGALIVRRREDLLTAFHRAPEYYRSNQPEDEPLHWYQYSMEGTRRFRGLKLWMSWKHLGTEGLGHLIEQNDDLAAYLAARCAEADDFEANPAVPELSVVCFRHLPDGWTHWPDAVLDDYQTRLQRALEVSGEAWVSTTVLRDHTYLRAGVVNYLSTSEDIDRLLSTLRAISEGVLEDLDLR